MESQNIAEPQTDTQHIPDVQPDKPPAQIQSHLPLAVLILFILCLLVALVLHFRNRLVKKQAVQLPPPAPASTPAPIPNDTISPTPDPTAGWKTYTNVQYKYEFKCPLTSIYKNSDLNNPDGIIYPYIQESCYDNQNQVSIAVWKITNRDIFTLEGKTKELSGAFLKPVDYKETDLNQHQMIAYKEQNLSNQIERSVAIILLTNEYIKIDGFSQDFFNQILSTFVFTGAENTSGTSVWKTYTSTEMGVSFNYPENFRVSEDYTVGTGLVDNGISVDLDQAEGQPIRWISIFTTSINPSIPKSWFDDLIKLSPGQTKSLPQNTDSPDEYSTWTRIADTVIDNRKWYVFENTNLWEIPPPLRIYVINYKNDYYYIKTTYSQFLTSDVKELKNFPATVDQILSTFKFTN